MLNRVAETVIEHVLTKVPHATNLLPNESKDQQIERQDCLNRLSFYRELTRSLVDSKIDSKYQDEKNNLKVLYRELLDAVFAEFSKKGCCGEMTSIAFFYYLELGIQNSIEEIILKNTKTGQKHAFIVLDRDVKTDLNEPNQWGEFVLCDPWRQCASQYDASYILQKKDLAYDAMPVNRIIIQPNLRLEKNFTSKDWMDLSDFLKEIKQHITEDLIQEAANHWAIKDNVQGLKKEIDEFLEKKSDYYLELSKKQNQTKAKVSVTTQSLFNTKQPQQQSSKQLNPRCCVIL